MRCPKQFFGKIQDRRLFKIAAALVVGALTASAAPIIFPDSIRAVPAEMGGDVQVMRPTLRTEELAAPLTFAVHLRMRDFDELQARLEKGEAIPPAEMEARYLPLKSAYDRVVAWLTGNGFDVVFLDRNHTVVFARGRVARISQAMNVTFARVRIPEGSAYPAGEFTSAITAPSLPEEIAGPVLGIDGLQPHIQPRHSPISAAVSPAQIPGYNGAAPSDIAAHYNVPSTWTGQGQTIAVLDEAPALSSDLTTYWSTVGVSQSIANVTQIATQAGTPTGPGETTLDVEWAGALAPAAQIRVYYAPSVFATLPYVINNLPAGSIVSISWIGIEDTMAPATAQFYAQSIAQLAAAKISVFASAGDAGSNPSFVNNRWAYNASMPLSAGYPASDPNVTGVGGTTITFDSNYVSTSETVWNNIANTGMATGGGYSGVFSAPSWQTGTNSSMRCTPDVAAVSTCASPVNGCLGFLNGSITVFDGTSVSSPVWAAFCAMVNQSRASAGLGPIGLLGPHIYPLAGSNVFTDITTGNNGVYSAGPGYDPCSGLGVPNVAALINALSVTSVTIFAQPQSATVYTGGSFSLSVAATSNTVPLTYQWYFNGAPISGQTNATFSKSNAQTSDTGSYAVTVSDGVGSVTSAPATVTVSAPPGSPAPVSGGGGGGAQSKGFYAALGLLIALRMALQSRRTARAV
ncbi:MAG: protease pro-enzyme activation domain-containing protein [Opitutaceae bacterium]|jgi:kumamolisin